LCIKQYDWKSNKLKMVAVTVISSVYLATRLFSV
jgi:hypothetical protein